MLLVPSRFGLFACVLTVAAACSSGGAGLVTADGGAPRAAASDASAPPDDEQEPIPSPPKDAGARTDAKKPDPTSYPLTCEGLCAKADAKLAEGCDATKCVSQCKLRAKEASEAPAGGCNAEWSTYLECAVLGGTMTTCAFNGKLTLGGCYDEESALLTCNSKPRVCPTNCTSDAQCQSECPVFPGGNNVNCCDTTVGYCYTTSSSFCR